MQQRASDQNGSEGGHRFRCIVLAGEEGEGLASLVEALRRKCADVYVVADAPGVIAELADDRRDLVVVYQPKCVRGVEELLEAIDRYFPTVKCRKYGDTGSERVDDQSAARGDASQRTAPPTDGADDKPAAGSLDVDAKRAAVAKTRHRVDKDRGVRTTDGDAPLVTEQELAMLIGPLPTEDAVETTDAEGPK